MQVTSSSHAHSQTVAGFESPNQTVIQVVEANLKRQQALLEQILFKLENCESKLDRLANRQEKIEALFTNERRKKNVREPATLPLIPTPTPPVTRSDPVSFVDVTVEIDRSKDLDSQFLAKTVTLSEVHVLDRANIRLLDRQGKLLALFLHNALDSQKYQKELDAVHESTRGWTSQQRGHAAGFLDLDYYYPNADPDEFVIAANNLYARKADRKSTFRTANKHPSITLGYLGHAGKFVCRASNVQGRYPMLLTSMIPLLNDITSLFARCAPETHQMQSKALEKVKNFKIATTPFTTVTVNKSANNRPTTYFHYDSENLPESYVAMFVNGRKYSGGETVFPAFIHPETGKKIAFACNNGDLLFFDGSKILHGNTPVQLEEEGIRNSFVCYAHKRVVTCKNAKCNS